MVLAIETQSVDLSDVILKLESKDLDYDELYNKITDFKDSEDPNEQLLFGYVWYQSVRNLWAESELFPEKEVGGLISYLMKLSTDFNMKMYSVEWLNQSCANLLYYSAMTEFYSFEAAKIFDPLLTAVRRNISIGFEYGQNDPLKLKVFCFCSNNF